jgi:hypothetical protein
LNPSNQTIAQDAFSGVDQFTVRTDFCTFYPLNLHIYIQRYSWTWKIIKYRCSNKYLTNSEGNGRGKGGTSIFKQPQLEMCVSQLAPKWLFFEVIFILCYVI